jgi:hypothetical protein
LGKKEESDEAFGAKNANPAFSHSSTSPNRDHRTPFSPMENHI